MTSVGAAARAGGRANVRGCLCASRVLGPCVFGAAHRRQRRELGDDRRPVGDTRCLRDVQAAVAPRHSKRPRLAGLTRTGGGACCLAQSVRGSQNSSRAEGGACGRVPWTFDSQKEAKSKRKRRVGRIRCSPPSESGFLRQSAIGATPSEAQLFLVRHGDVRSAGAPPPASPVTTARTLAPSVRSAAPGLLETGGRSCGAVNRHSLALPASQRQPPLHSPDACPRHTLRQRLASLALSAAR